MNTSKITINKLTALVSNESYEELFQFINIDEDAKKSLLEIDKLVNVNYAHTTKSFSEEFFLALNETEIVTLIRVFTLLDGRINELTFDTQTPIPMLFHRLKDLNYSYFNELLEWVFKNRTNKHIFPFGWDRYDEAKSLKEYYLFVEKAKLKSEIYRLQNNVRSIEKKLLNPNKVTNDLKDAIKRNDVRSLDALIRKGADIYIKDDDGRALKEKVDEIKKTNKVGFIEKKYGGK